MAFRIRQRRDSSGRLGGSFLVLENEPRVRSEAFAVSFRRLCDDLAGVVHRLYVSARSASLESLVLSVGID